MSGLSQHQHVFRVAKRDATNDGTQSHVAKRNRQSVSCLPCRTRKLKCDRQIPCVSCSKRGDETSCAYSNGATNGRDRRGGEARDSEAQLRLQKLEEMVTSLMRTTKEDSEILRNEMSPQAVIADQRFNNLPPPTSDSSPEAQLNMNGPERSYVNATHWTAILENIRDIQGVLEQHPGDTGEIQPPVASNGPDIVLDTNQSMTLTDACNSLPPRPTLNKLLSVYFNSMHSQTPILHTGKFLREYESFSVEPSSVSFLWISMLFSALYIGSQIHEGGDQEVLGSSNSPPRATFLKRAGQALIAGRYQKAKPYSVEAVLLYGVCKYIQKEEQDNDAWMIMGISTRLAMKMGYHRDPGNLVNISPFEGEMRRRTFCILEAFDLLLSFQAGLPTVIYEEECDTEPPSNLFDTDFDEDCKALPPSRPPIDSTPMLYYRYKSRLAKIFRRIHRHALSFKISSYEDTMKLDAELEETHKDVPPSLRMRPLALSFTDQPYMILNRLYSDLLYLKSICVLHRKYLSQDRSDPSFGYSRRVCGDAALHILKHQAELHGACQPGGLFYDHKWMLSSLSCHDFLLAAMITCLDLYEFHKQSATSSAKGMEAQVKKYDALKHSHGIWTSRREFSRDARYASSVLAVMLSKVPRPSFPGKAPQKISSMTQTPMNGNGPFGATVSHPESSPWNMDEFDLTDQELLTNNYAPLDFASTSTLNTVFSEFDNIDWGLVDQSLVGLIGDDDVPFDWQLLDASEAQAVT
ncbi:hypothetical protein HO173_000087 [Letharia columbiana]|uniref:Zn(2)-C6 fungal-type domain-containing protein n=1 Tax=Letharia columbiana TaxID=112416 RepID=A0A8H6LAA8_9LECA|nr:uncharacterized protein HO173_000087 [Letharia columbiana]KAF6241377.1 hypothetical protein HO173_000087 [Letharia columbiana]